ncbi:DUF6286 domain-containing protein [Amycolatopsis sp. cmx-4-83]|uniref:DUF6286 domain-containing protein n=1 Tax=Amycolatopsis sp. cmx-4-83 TaxID=2790940 RepID=UPI00397E7A34
MKRRPRRSVPALLSALVLLGACVVITVVAVQMLLGERPWLSYDAVAGTLHDLRWTDVLPAVAGGVLALLGLVLVLAAVVPGAATVLPLNGLFDAGAARGGYRSTLRAAAAGVDGVARARVKLGKRRAKIRVDTTRSRPEGLADAVHAAVTQRLEQIGPAGRPTVTVRVRAPRRNP